MELEVNDLDIQSDGQVSDRLAGLLRSRGQVLKDLRHVESEKMSLRLGSYELVGIKAEVCAEED